MRRTRCFSACEEANGGDKPAVRDLFVRRDGGLGDEEDSVITFGHLYANTLGEGGDPRVGVESVWQSMILETVARDGIDHSVGVVCVGGTLVYLVKEHPWR